MAESTGVCPSRHGKPAGLPCAAGPLPHGRPSADARPCGRGSASSGTRIDPPRFRALHLVAAAEAPDPQQALIHRALATGRPDAALAAALEEAAVAVGSPAHASLVSTRQLLVWAADLSADRSAREHRLLLAALHDLCGENPLDMELWARIETLPPSPLRHAAWAGRAVMEDRFGAALDHLRAARRGLAFWYAREDEVTSPGSRLNPVPSAGAVIDTVEAAVACRMARGGATVDAATRALDARVLDTVQARAARRLLLAGQVYAAGPHHVLRLLGDSTPATPGRTATPEAAERWSSRLLLVRGECRVLTGDLEAAAGDLREVLRRHQASPGHPERRRALERLTIAHFLLGNWQEAEAVVDGIDTAGGGTAGRALRALLSAFRGSGAPPRRGSWVPPAPTTPGAAEPDHVVIATVARILALSAHRHHGDVLAAIRWLTAPSSALEDAPAKFAPLWLPARAEAAVETATGASSLAGLAELHECAERIPYLMVTHHRLAGRAAELRGNPTAAVDAYEEGLSTAKGCAHVPPVHLAQLESAYGRLLCLLGHTASGLRHLERAQHTFASLGAFPFDHRCTQERAALAERASPLWPDGALTERGLAVARLVVSGLTNSQVAENLLISEKAVEHHLGRIYRTLGVRTRAELASRWPR
ncbi:helix-turn-helix transcriptional regulator [Streptacidiphilus anmyonensis]|uniref:helix-turn-helix transcriptional regulator n=1 Tax=Streptacidiphilus anmyonensis TaxID=405782 RepID=UPI00128D5214|nr:helix-turn-helix transcriptional regulator [Streptacidiphilus anmyonensis]